MTNETEKPPIDAVRAKIEEMRAISTWAQADLSALEVLSDAVNALEAVLDATTVGRCAARRSGEICDLYRAQHLNAGWPHKFKPDETAAAVEAALTRAITKGEQ